MLTADSAAPAAAPAGQARLFLADGSVKARPGAPELKAAMDSPAPFWLDLTDLGDEMADRLEHALGVHPLVIEDAQQFGELPRIEEFDDYIAVVLYGPGVGAHLLSTVRQAADLDYRITVLADACADTDPEVHRVLMEKVFPKQALVTDTGAWIETL